MNVIQAVQSKKEYMYLSENFIQSVVDEAIRLDKKLRSDYESGKESAQKKLVKLVREKARKIYGVFQVPSLIEERKSLLERGSLTDIPALLESHLSTKERVPYYADFFTVIFALTGEPKSILDLAGGLNVLAYYHYSQGKASYVANELSAQDCAQLNAFFARNKLPAEAISFDVVSEMDKIPSQKFDVCFLLKALDTLERQKRYCSYDILDKINAKFIVATFPRVSVKGVATKRGDEVNWFLKVIERKGLTYHKLLFESEICYVCFRA